jgi:ABC-2 type transport system ATP-binding protein
MLSSGGKSRTVLSVSDLSKLYRSGVGVEHVDVEVDAGEAVALLGPNGSGKTTTIKCIAGLLLPDAGLIRLNGHPPGTEPAQSAMAYVPDNPDLYPALTVEEHLRFRAQAFRLRDNLEQRLREAMDEVDIVELADRLGGELSRGQRQRAMLAGAVLQEASLLVLDEPTVGLDPITLRWLERWLRSQAEAGAGVLVASHSLDFVARVADRAVVLVGGEVVAEDDVPKDEDSSRKWREQLVDRLASWRPGA